MNHSSLQSLPHLNGELLIAGEPITTVAGKLNTDSFFAYNKQAITERITDLKKALPNQLGLHYAIKANPYAPLVKHVCNLVDGFDVASAKELALALECGMLASQISIAGPGKSNADLTLAIQSAVLINVESSNEARRIAELSQILGLPARVALRINPAFELRSSGMKMGGGPRPFGVDEELAPDLLKQFNQLELNFEGFHIYAGSQNLNAANIIESQQKSYELAVRLANFAPSPVRSLNLGGGFGIPYFPNETPLEISPIADTLASIVDAASSAIPDAKLHLELGRYLVGEAGIYATKIIDKKMSRGTTYLITAGGMNHHLAASGNLGQIIRKNYPVVIANKLDQHSIETVSIHGPLCTPLDVLAHQVELPTAEVGDWVVLFQSGAYGPSASPQGFLSQTVVAEILL